MRWEEYLTNCGGKNLTNSWQMSSIRFDFVIFFYIRFYLFVFFVSLLVYFICKIWCETWWRVYILTVYLRISFSIDHIHTLLNIKSIKIHYMRWSETKNESKSFSLNKRIYDRYIYISIYRYLYMKHFSMEKLFSYIIS